MSGTRVYVPCTLALLADVVTAGGVGPVPFQGHAVTEALQAEYAEGSEEEWEYAACAAAAEDALALLQQEEVPCRVVLAVDCEGVRALDEEDPTLVEVDEPVPLRRVAAILVDTEDARADVAAAVESLADAGRGDPDAVAVVERCLDNDLAWYATQEIDDLLALPDAQE